MLYRLERGFAAIADYPGTAAAKRKVLLQWEWIATPAIMELEALAEQYNDDEIREAIAHTRARTGYPKCEITLGKALR